MQGPCSHLPHDPWSELQPLQNKPVPQACPLQQCLHSGTLITTPSISTGLAMQPALQQSSPQPSPCRGTRTETLGGNSTL